MMNLEVEIITWNIGKNMKSEKIIELGTYLKNTDITFLCLQECDGTNNIRILDCLSSKDIIITEISNIGNTFLKFKIITYAIFQKNISISFCNTTKTYNFGTKGFIMTDMKIEKNESLYNIVLINSHFPFRNKIKHWYNQLNDIINLLESATTQNIFITGDINSRSLFTKEGYTKNVSYSRNYRYIYNLLRQYNITSSPTNHISTKKYELIRYLVSVDFLKKLTCSNQILELFDEETISFLPTYKYDSLTGEYLLKKYKHYRLPGYPDRILFRKNNHIKCKKYTSLPIKGNDHAPVYGTFLIYKKAFKYAHTKKIKNKKRKIKMKYNNDRCRICSVLHNLI